MIHIDCTGMDTNVIEHAFMASRDRMSEDPIVDEIQEILAEELRKHEGLKKWNQYRYEQQSMSNSKDEKFMEKVVSKLIQDNRSLLSYLGLGGKIKDKKQPGPVEIPRYEGKRFPTFLKILNFNPEKGIYRKQIPINSFALVRFETDVSNNYFDRESESGKFILSPNLSKSMHLWNGIITTKIVPRENAKEEEIDSIKTELTRPYDEPLTTEFEVEYTAPIKKEGEPSKEKKRKPRGSDYSLPRRTLVFESKTDGCKAWTDMDPQWNGRDIAKVTPIPENDSKDNIEVFINMDADVLHNFLQRQQISIRQRELTKRSYEIGIFLFALVLYNELEDFEDRNELLPIVMKGVSKITLDLIWNERLSRELEL